MLILFSHIYHNLSLDVKSHFSYKEENVEVLDNTKYNFFLLFVPFPLQNICTAHDVSHVKEMLNVKCRYINGPNPCSVLAPQTA